MLCACFCSRVVCSVGFVWVSVVSVVVAVVIAAVVVAVVIAAVVVVTTIEMYKLCVIESLSSYVILTEPLFACLSTPV